MFETSRSEHGTDWARARTKDRTANTRLNVHVTSMMWSEAVLGMDKVRKAEFWQALRWPLGMHISHFPCYISIRNSTAPAARRRASSQMCQRARLDVSLVEPAALPLSAGDSRQALRRWRQKQSRTPAAVAAMSTYGSSGAALSGCDVGAVMIQVRANPCPVQQPHREKCASSAAVPIIRPLPGAVRTRPRSD